MSYSPKTHYHNPGCFIINDGSFKNNTIHVISDAVAILASWLASWIHRSFFCFRRLLPQLTGPILRGTRDATKNLRNIESHNRQNQSHPRFSTMWLRHTSLMTFIYTVCVYWNEYGMAYYFGFPFTSLTIHWRPAVDWVMYEIKLHDIHHPLTVAEM